MNKNLTINILAIMYKTFLASNFLFYYKQLTERLLYYSIENVK